MKKDKIYVLPCSGIGKVYGLLSRIAAQKVVVDLEPDKTDTICLASLLLEEMKDSVRNKSVICIDGCPKSCAEKSSVEAGMMIEKKYLTSQFVRNYRGLDPGTGSELTETGNKIADDIAKTIQSDIQNFFQEKEVG